MSPTSRLFTRTLTTPKDIAQARGEAEGLHYIRLTSRIAPELYRFQSTPSTSDTDGSSSGEAKEVLIESEYLNLGGRMDEGGQRALARELAAMHRPLDQKELELEVRRRKEVGLPGLKDEDQERIGVMYGFPVPTHCGATEQDNTWEKNWARFYRDRRLGDMVRRLGDVSVQKEWDGMQDKVIPLLLDDITPPPQPVILHGDLWSGNKGMALNRPGVEEASPAVFDPAAYFGHNEADLGIMHMFGGFSPAFFDEYHRHHPLSSPHYEQRQKLYELYHHLNHALMFGGGYKSGALGIMRDLNAWAEGVPDPAR